ncbi:Leo1-like protein-domain-containing protein [Abortiporus biennis]|nr:Leo1-like protein-domain-containing protein [Abortiporus biennis]
MSLADALIPPVKHHIQDDEYDTPEHQEEDIDMHAQDYHTDEDGRDNESQKQDEDMQDLFGEDTIAEEIKHDEPTTPASSEHYDGISSPERKHREALEYAEEDEPEEPQPKALEVNLPLPNIPMPRSSDGTHWVLRMPNFVNVDSKPFHPETYIGPEQEDDDTHHAENLREKSMSIKLKVENTVRWRWVKDKHGQDQRQSNSRIIRWSDGSLSLKLGKELFDINQNIDTSGGASRSTIGNNSQPSLSQPQSQPIGGKTPVEGLTYLVAQHKHAGMLQCEAAITGYMSLRPTGMQSETHRMLVRAVGQKHNKVARLRMAPDPTMDPEKEKMELLKLAAKKPKKTRGEDDGFGSTRKRRASSSRKRTDDMWSDDDSDEDDFGLGLGGGGGSEDEFGGGDGRHGKRKKSGGSGGGGGEENGKKGPGEYQTDDFLVSDSDEDGGFGDSDDEGTKKRKRRHRDDEDADEDDLEKLEKKIEAEQEKQRKQRDVSGKAVASDDEHDAEHGGNAMDVESEEDEEEWGVRKAGTASGSRKKRTIEVEEEEEEED